VRSFGNKDFFGENVNFYLWSDFGVPLEKLIHHSIGSPVYVLVIETECGWDPFNAISNHYGN